MSRKLFFLAFIACLMLSACSRRDENKEWNLTNDSLRYASLLDIARADSFVLVTIKNPWMQEKDLHRYILVPDTAPVPKSYPEGTLLRTPLRRVVMHNAVHAALVSELGCSEALTGLCDIEYVKSPILRRLLDSGEIVDAGSSVQSDIERYITMRTDAVFISPLEHVSYDLLEKVRIPYVECADYMEASPLGRAEWILLFGLLFDCEERARQLFNEVECNYTTFCDKVKLSAKRPRLIVDMLNGGAWHVPGGKSFLGQLFVDAGADYFMAQDERRGSVPLSFETVYSKGADADFWLIKGARTGGLSYDIIKREHVAYATFAPWKKGKVYFCNTLSNDYYERIPFHPDVLLRELAYLFHPDCFSEPNVPQYYLPLK